MILKNLHSIMSNLAAEVERLLRQISSPPVKNVTKEKVAVIGSDGVERHLDADQFVNKEY